MSLNVTIVHLESRSIEEVGVPSNAECGRVAHKVAELLMLPAESPEGVPLRYRLARETPLDPVATLGAAGVKDGEWLELLANEVSARPFHPGEPAGSPVPADLAAKRERRPGDGSARLDLADREIEAAIPDGPRKIAVIVPIDEPAGSVAAATAKLLGLGPERPGFGFVSGGELLEPDLPLSAHGLSTGAELRLLPGVTADDEYDEDIAVRFGGSTTDVVVIGSDAATTCTFTAPDNAPMARVIRALAAGHPGLGIRPDSDALLDLASRRLLAEQESLGGAGIVSGEMLQVVPGVLPWIDMTGPTVGVLAVDALGSASLKTDLPLHAPSSRLIRELAEGLSLPRAGPDGTTLEYCIHHKQSGRQVAEHESLAQAGVEPQDVLRVVPHCW